MVSDSNLCPPSQLSTLSLGDSSAVAIAEGGCTVFAVAADGDPGPVVDARPFLIFSQPIGGGPRTPLVRALGRVSHASLFGSRLHWYRASGFGDMHRYFEWRSLTDDAFGGVELTERNWRFDYMTSGPGGIYVSFHVSGDDAANGIYLFAPDGTRQRIVALKDPGPVAADSEALYYLTGRFQTALVRRSLADGSETTLGTGMSWSVTVDRDNVYTQGPNTYFGFVSDGEALYLATPSPGAVLIYR